MESFEWKKWDKSESRSNVRSENRSKVKNESRFSRNYRWAVWVPHHLNESGSMSGGCQVSGGGTVTALSDFHHLFKKEKGIRYLFLEVLNNVFLGWCSTYLRMVNTISEGSLAKTSWYYPVWFLMWCFIPIIL